MRSPDYKEYRTALVKQVFAECDKMTEEGLKNFTPWDVLYRILTRHAEGYLIILKADFQILTLIAQGLSASAISNTLGIPSMDVRKTASTWGMTPLDQSLDFNPLMVYNTNMSAFELEAEMNQILAVPINSKISTVVVHNIERYYDLLQFLKEEDK